MKNLIFVDVEAAEGISPYNGKMTEFGAVDFDSRQTFHGILWESKPHPDNPAMSMITGGHRNERQVMLDFEEWLKAMCGKNRPIFVSDNPAYDWQWISYHFDKALGQNPFGHSARRISDFYAGTMKDFSRTQDWKKWRKTPHDHNPVNDAMGNVEAFAKILETIKD